MAREFLGVYLHGTDKSFKTELEAFCAADELKPQTQGKLLYKDKYYSNLPEWRVVSHLLKLAGSQPEAFFVSPLADQVVQTPTGTRTLNVRHRDWAGECFINIKGAAATTNGEDQESQNILSWHANHRRPLGYQAGAGREVLDDAHKDIQAFQKLVESHPSLLFDLNAPIWRPVGVASHKTGIAAVYNYESSTPFQLVDTVVSARRIPFSPFRLEEYVMFNTIPQSAEQGFNELKSLWGVDDEGLFIRGVSRLGRAMRLFHEARLIHRQSFRVVTNTNINLGLGVSAWMNFNNIGIDGSLGDNDDVEEMTERREWWKNAETFGSFCMYLMFMGRLKPELIKNNEFIIKLIDTWNNSLGKEIVTSMRETPTFMINGRNNTFDVVLQSIIDFIGWYANPKISILPNGAPGQTITYTGYAQYQSSSTWVPVAAEVVRSLSSKRSALEL